MSQAHSVAPISVSDSRTHFLYLRVSTNNQQGGLASQLNALQNYCRQQGISDYRIFQDEGVSGAKCSRPALDAMMKEITEGRCKTLIVFSFSRFSRSCTHLLQSLETLRKYNTQFVSISEQINTETAVGQALLAVLGALAQLERDLIRERVVAGIARARQAGRHIGRVKTRPSEMIRALRASGLSLREVARVAKTSHGSVSLEMKVWHKEAKAQGKTLQDLIDEFNRKRSPAAKKSGTTIISSVSATSTAESGLKTSGVELAMDSSAQPIELEIIR